MNPISGCSKRSRCEAREKSASGSVFADTLERGDRAERSRWAFFNGLLTPGEIARTVGRSVPRVSNVLAALRLAEVVRYESDGKHNYYRLKHPSDIRQPLASLSRFVKAASKVPARGR